ncbi:GGDEF domain-containing protein [Wenxinia marina]|nr:diguanylate cyclase [Wenxinia marina]
MDLLLNFVNGLGMMALATGSYAIVQRRGWDRYVRHLLIGLVFGVGASLMMFNTVVVGPGVIVDSRNLFVAFSGAFVGPVGAAASLLVACTTRLAIGGSGAALGIASMMLAAGVGLVWNQGRLLRSAPNWARFSAMGLTVSLSLATVLLLPAEQRNSALQNFVPILVAFNILGALIFGAMIERERALARHERRLTRQTMTDPLTGALNRRGLARRYEDLMPRMEERGGALLLMDLDHFKAVNDTHGHAIGDEVLKGAVAAAQDVCRAEDSVVRIGGEEFAILLPAVGAAAAYRIAERVRLSIEGMTLPDCPRLQVTTSIGVVHFDGGVPLLSEALTRSDRALYAAKRGGRNRTVADVLSPVEPPAQPEASLLLQPRTGLAGGA